MIAFQISKDLDIFFSTIQVFFLLDTKVLFVESICRVKSLSLSGMILYYLADSVLVQWKELKEKYPRVDFVGTLM